MIGLGDAARMSSAHERHRYRPNGDYRSAPAYRKATLDPPAFAKRSLPRCGISPATNRCITSRRVRVSWKTGVRKGWRVLRIIRGSRRVRRALRHTWLWLVHPDPWTPYRSAGSPTGDPHRRFATISDAREGFCNPTSPYSGMSLKALMYCADRLGARSIRPVSPMTRWYA